MRSSPVFMFAWVSSITNFRLLGNWGPIQKNWSSSVHQQPITDHSARLWQKLEAAPCVHSPCKFLTGGEPIHLRMIFIPRSESTKKVSNWGFLQLIKLTFTLCLPFFSNKPTTTYKCVRYIHVPCDTIVTSSIRDPLFQLLAVLCSDG